nr:hypothetical protein [Tanacetum cinerariifolium]
ADEGTGLIPWVLDVPSDESEEELSWRSTDDEGDGEEDQGLNVEREEGLNEEEEEDNLYRDVNINQGRGLQATLEVEDTHVTLTLVNPDGDSNAVFAVHYLEEGRQRQSRAMIQAIEKMLKTRRIMRSLEKFVGGRLSHPEHVALYEPLEVSMERANRDELLVEKDKSHKRRSPAQTSSAWKMSDTRDSPSSWDATDFLFKEDYTIVPKPRAIIYKDRNDQKKMMRENEVHKFSDGTLTRFHEKLDHMVKDFRLFKYNPGMDNRIWFEDDKMRSKEFMKVIDRRLKIKRIFSSLKSFVGRRFRDVDYMTLNRKE